MNDDWAYGQSVRNFLETGSLRFERWMAMTLVTQVLWGALFANVFGFSFLVLRCSTLALGLAAVLVFYQLVRDRGGRPELALAAALWLAFNPWFFTLSFTFMTDVPFLALFLLSLLLFGRFTGSGQWPWLVAATLAAVAATLIRQYGLLAPLMFAVDYSVRERRPRAAVVAVLPLALTWAAMSGYIAWLASTTDLPGWYGRPSLLLERLRQTDFCEVLPERSGLILAYGGFFLLPFVAVRLRQVRKLKKWQELAALLPAAALTAAVAVPAWDELPAGNILYNLGLGPQLLKDGYFGDNRFVALPPWLGGLVKGAAFAGAAGLLWLAFRSFFRLRKAAPGLTGGRPPVQRPGEWAGVLVFCAYLYIDYYFWDRYLLVPLPLLLLLLVSSSKEDRPPVLPALLFLVPLALFSIAATHDYLAWNRARWEALADLGRAGVAPGRIDGGFEFNTWKATGPRRAISRRGKSWWQVGDDEYVVAFDDIGCYQRRRSYPFYRWLPPGRDSLALLHREPFLQQDTLRTDAERRTADSTSFLSTAGAPAFGNGLQQDDARSHSGRYSVRLDPTQPYGFGLALSGTKPCDRLLVSAWRYAPYQTGFLAVTAPEGVDLYEVEAAVVEKEPSGWERVLHEVTLPADWAGHPLTIYVWNSVPEPVWFDDIEVVWLKH